MAGLARGTTRLLVFEWMMGSSHIRRRERRLRRCGLRFDISGADARPVRPAACQRDRSARGLERQVLVRRASAGLSQPPWAVTEACGDSVGAFGVRIVEDVAKSNSRLTETPRRLTLVGESLGRQCQQPNPSCLEVALTSLLHRLKSLDPFRGARGYAGGSHACRLRGGALEELLAATAGPGATATAIDKRRSLRCGLSGLISMVVSVNLDTQVQMQNDVATDFR